MLKSLSPFNCFGIFSVNGMMGIPAIHSYNRAPIHKEAHLDDWTEFSILGKNEEFQVKRTDQ
jgi:hypothetical protein